jgi:hypothetical protein
MKLALIACAPLVVLAACATPQASIGGGGAAPVSGAMYCWKDRLVAADGKLQCNWNADAREACKSSFVTDLPRERVAGEPREGNFCPNGQRLVAVQVR